MKFPYYRDTLGHVVINATNYTDLAEIILTDIAAGERRHLLCSQSDFIHRFTNKAWADEAVAGRFNVTVMEFSGEIDPAYRIDSHIGGLFIPPMSCYVKTKDDVEPVAQMLSRLYDGEVRVLKDGRGVAIYVRGVLQLGFL